jgi:hypothetical protein
MTTTFRPKNKGKIVDTHHVDQLISTYKKERWLSNTEKLGKPDSLSTWYGIKELSQFLQLAKQCNANGIKMYYGVYPDDFSGAEELKGRQTVVLVATKEKTTPTGTTNKDIYVSRNGKSEILAFNLGEICPPFCTTGLPDDPWNISIEMEKIGITIVDTQDKILII